MDVVKPLALVASLALFADAASAAIVAVGGTGSEGAGGFTLESGVIVDVPSTFYFAGATTPASGWVWESSQASNPLTFLFDFSLSESQVSTASLTGLWGIDNTGSVELNGTVISELPIVTASNFTSLTPLSAASDLFVAGANVLSFQVANAGGPAAFRASVTVETESVGPSPIPGPAALPLLGGALALLGLGARARKPRVQPRR